MSEPIEKWRADEVRFALRKAGSRLIKTDWNRQELLGEVRSTEILVGHFTDGSTHFTRDVTADGDWAEAWHRVGKGKTACVGLWAVPREHFYG